MPSINSLMLTYDALNEESTFSEGDTITGKVVLMLQKETSVECFFVKLKGDANVHWSEKRGEHNHSYTAHRRLFKAKQLFTPKNSKETVLPAGTHVHNFSLGIPSTGMPSSFKGCHGRIVYLLEAKVSRSWRMDTTAAKVITFASKCFPDVRLMSQQFGTVDKDLGLFSKGKVRMDATVDRTGYAPGDTINIVVKVSNSSSKDVKPKFSLKQTVLYRAQGSKKHGEKSISKMAGDIILPNKEGTVRCAMEIPTDTSLTMHNCELITVEYKLKVYLDISFSFDPEVDFPIIIFSKSCRPGGAMAQYPAEAFGGPSRSDFCPPAASMRPVSPSRGAYGYPPNPPTYPNNPQMHAGPFPMYPLLPSHMAGAYSNPLPRGPSPYGSPFSSAATSPVHHPPPAGQGFHPPPSAPAIPSPSFAPASAPEYQPAPSAPAFQSPPTAPELLPPSYNSTLFNATPTGPMYMPSSLAVTNTDFLSQSDEGPPAYLSLFPPTSTGDSTTGSSAK
ncbi:arrestin domain-containing protein 3-like [Genypterus blacodes]|uniref:arrestin domain-containing protein 3-like n=1 Tax=Genypterus blacodes TaxID=154954 RepID=UPI003F76458E